MPYSRLPAPGCRNNSDPLTSKWGATFQVPMPRLAFVGFGSAVALRVSVQEQRRMARRVQFRRLRGILAVGDVRRGAL